MYKRTTKQLGTIFLVLLGLNSMARDMYADSLIIGHQYYFTLSSDSVTQKVILKPIGDFEIYYSIWVGKNNSPGYHIAGKATQNGTFQSSDGEVWFYTSEDGSLDINIFGNDAQEINVYQRPVLDKKMVRREPSSPTPILPY